MRIRSFTILFAVDILLCARTLRGHSDTLSGPAKAAGDIQRPQATQSPF